MTVGDELTKILIDLPNNSGIGGESVWAKALGGDLYELHNSPFYAYGLNYLDVVRAIASSPDQKPIVAHVERRSGHRTLRLKFPMGHTNDQCAGRLKELDHLSVTCEGTGDGLYSLDIPEKQSYQAVCDQLWKWERDDILVYETCKARRPDGFDAPPDVS